MTRQAVIAVLVLDGEHRCVTAIFALTDAAFL